MKRVRSSSFNHLKHKFHLNNIFRSVPTLKKITRFHFRDHLVNDSFLEIISIYTEKHIKHINKYTLCAK
jgi:hypothetical protein